MASDAIDFDVDELLDTSDFTLNPDEVAKGAKAVERLIATVKGAELKRAVEDQLHTLAILISGGSCDAIDFPWHQLRSFHSAAALAILREEGIPAKIEGWRCQLDETRKFHQVPKKFTPGNVQKLITTLRKLLKECHELGYITAEERDNAITPSKATKVPATKGRLLSDPEFRALASACNSDSSPAGPRDALIFYLGFQGGLRPGEIAQVAIKDLGFDKRRSRPTVRVREANKSRARVIPLENEALIALEDWMEVRESKEGPLLLELGRGGKVIPTRLTVAGLAEICDQRAAQAGVVPFAPQDLRRNWEARQQALKQRSSQPEEAPPVVASPLFSDPEPPTQAADKIQFPYLGRPQSLG